MGRSLLRIGRADAALDRLEDGYDSQHHLALQRCSRMRPLVSGNDLGRSNSNAETIPDEHSVAIGNAPGRTGHDCGWWLGDSQVLGRSVSSEAVSYTHLRAHETPEHLV